MYVEKSRGEKKEKKKDFTELQLKPHDINFYYFHTFVK